MPAVKPGQRLPSEPKLAAELGVSRSTLREVMRIFEGQGLIRRRQGIGTFVVSNEQSIDTGLEVLESIESLAHRTGQSVSMGVMNIVRRDATEEEAEALERGSKHRPGRDLARHPGRRASRSLTWSTACPTTC